MTATGTTSTKPTGDDRDSFAVYKIAAAISALTETVTVTERGNIVERRLNSTAKNLAFILAGFANTATGQLNPSRALLAKRMGCGQRQVGDAIHLLSAAGLLEVKHGRGNAASYRLIAPPDRRDTAVLDKRDTAVLDRRDTAVPYVNYEVELRTGTNNSCAAAQTSTKKNGSDEGAAIELADFIAEKAHQRPKVKPGDGERVHHLIVEYGWDEVKRCAEWAVASTFWRSPTTDKLVRFVGGFDAIREQMAEAAARDDAGDTSVTDPDFPVEADYSGGAAYAAEWEREQLAAAA
jgi:Helix-turn-helix domain